MATLTGVLLDVSGSMQINAGGKIKEKGGEWARSIFDVIDNLIKHDVSNDNYIFSVGVGANGRRPFFDVIETVKEVQHRYNKMHREKNAFMDMQRKEKIDMEKDREMNLYIKIKEDKSLKSLDTEIQREMSLYMELQREKNLFIWEKTLDVEIKRDNSLYIELLKNVKRISEQKKQNFYRKMKREKCPNIEMQWEKCLKSIQMEEQEDKILYMEMQLEKVLNFNMEHMQYVQSKKRIYIEMEEEKLKYKIGQWENTMYTFNMDMLLRKMLDMETQWTEILYKKIQQEMCVNMNLQWEKTFGIEIEREKTVDIEMARDTTLKVEMEREKILHMGMQWGMISEIDMLQEVNRETGMQYGKYFDEELERKKTIYMEEQWGKNADMDKQWEKILDIGRKRRHKYHEYPLVEWKYNEMYVHDGVNKNPYSLSHRLYKLNITPYDDVLEEFYQLVEKNGAQTTRIWAPKDEIQSVVCYSLAVYILDKLKTDEEFLKVFIQKCLPPACRDIGGENIIGKLVNRFQMFNCRIASRVLVNIDEVVKNISMVFEKAKVEYKEVVQSRHFTEYFDETMMKNVGSVFSVMTAWDICHDCRDDDISAERKTDEIMKVISPFIYGRTPLFEALNITLPIFLKDEFLEHTKVLFILSDGLPTDSGDVHVVSESLKHLNVIVVGCFISGYSNVEPRKLYSVEKEEWDEGAKFLFKLSSTIPSQLLPRTIFIKRGWDIDISNNETKLFLQINHPDHIHEACNLARNVVCCQDSLSDLLVSVSLDIYINQSTNQFTAREQEGDTCYANASAAVLHLAMKRILGRDEGYPDFNDLREKIVKLHGEKGANTLNVLEGITPEYRLHCKIVDAKDAMKAIAAKRPVVARFRLTDIEWTQFDKFFRRDPCGILTKAEIDLDKRYTDDKLSGHAVVLTSFNSECFRFMNSWGDNWADMGFFKVQNSKVLDFQFIDVFWTLNDLSKREIDYYKEHGAEDAEKIMKNFTGLQKATYKCPECAVNSLVTEFSGSLKEAVCPKCEKKFCSNEAGNILALNMYLTSLSK